MSNLFHRLSNVEGAGRDGLIQAQREAIVDLLFFCMAADRKAAFRADTLISRTVDKFSWDPKLPYKSFADRALANGRAAAVTPEARAYFLANVAQRLKTAEAKERALALCRGLLPAEGTVPPLATDVLAEIEQHLR
ncbi:MAG: hypothetical protein JWM32_491 [Verrucomicrobia bacterium]|nr:hypothetical protein [Verrucomicrobiota bacterium]